MSDVSRDEFDRLAGRVERIERSLTATIQLVAAEVVGLRTAMDERFDAVEQRFDVEYAMIGSEAEHADERHETVTTTLATHGELLVTHGELLGRIVDLLEGGRQPSA